MALDPKRTTDDFADAFLELLPRGWAWDRDRDKPLAQFVRGLAEIWAQQVQGGARKLVHVEAHPDTTLDMLPDWERNAGLPEDCYLTVEQSVEGRRALLLKKLKTEGGQSRAYFIGVAADLGYPEAYIVEWSPFRAGASGVGNPKWRTGSPLQRNIWRMHVGFSDVAYFRAGRSRVGQDPQAKLRRAQALECFIRRWKPAHTEVIFTYTIAPPLYPIDVRWFRTGGGHVGRDPHAKINRWGTYLQPPPVQAKWFRVGKSHVGLDPQADIFEWRPRETPAPVQAAWFRVGKSHVGGDPQARIARVVTH